jgi:hypothetical protein
MSILSALKQQHSSIDDLAKLPQTMIMQMAQKKQIDQDMVPAILSRKAELMDSAARNKALQQPNQAPPSIMEQLIAKNATAENPEQNIMMAPAPQSADEIGVGQLPVPERQYAGGGIIAFGGGGMPALDMEDDEDLAYELARDNAEMNMGSSIEDIYKMAKQGLGRLRASLPESYQSARAKTEPKTETKTSSSKVGVPEKKRGSHPYEADAIAAAKKVGLDPELMLHALYKETGGLKNPETAMSKAGAYGPMQLMAGTAKDLGVDRKNVQENILGGARYLKQQVDSFGDPILGLAAYNAGPGRVRQMIKNGLGIESLKPETQNYVRYAQGGDVRHFYEGDYVDPMMGTPMVTPLNIGSYQSAIPGSPENLLENGKITKKEYDKIMEKRASTKAAIEDAKKPPKSEAKADTPIDYDSTDAAIKRGNQQVGEDNIFSQILAQNKLQREENKKSAIEDKNMALLAAGLGMMGGSSPYFLQNVGTGGAKGLEQLAASKARRASENNALASSDLKAMYYGEENRRKNEALRAGMGERAIDNLSAYDAKLRKNFFMEGVPPTPKQQEAYEAARRSDALYQRLARDANLASNAQSAPVYTYNPKTRSI